MSLSHIQSPPAESVEFCLLEMAVNSEIVNSETIAMDPFLKRVVVHSKSGRVFLQWTSKSLARSTY